MSKKREDTDAVVYFPMRIPRWLYAKLLKKAKSEARQRGDTRVNLSATARAAIVEYTKDEGTNAH
jgi:hypothetical protein